DVAERRDRRRRNQRLGTALLVLAIAVALVGGLLQAFGPRSKPPVPPGPRGEGGLKTASTRSPLTGATSGSWSTPTRSTRPGHPTARRSPSTTDRPSPSATGRPHRAISTSSTRKARES